MVENNAAKCFPEGWNAAPKPCDSCNSASALLFCRKDSAFLCMACDVKLHRHTKHERVWMCEVCEQSPASVMCKADAATLCVSCDRDIHSANPLARRHERIPVVPFYNSAEAVVNSTAGSLLDTVPGYGSSVLNNSVPKDDNDSWAIPRDSTNITGDIPSDTSPAVMKSLDLLSASDRLFDFGFAIPTYVGLENQIHDPINDCVVPMDATVPTKNFSSTPIDDHKSPPGSRYEIDFTRCINNSYDKSNSQSHSRSVSSSSMDAGVVPEENSLLDVTNPYMLSVNGGGMYCAKKAKAFCAVDREARVLRYREKRKNRKFEKKIRYASRKAYAEMRPRIKGRFAKRTDSTKTTTTELDVDQWLFTAENNSHSYGAEVEYGVVPSF